MFTVERTSDAVWAVRGAAGEILCNAHVEDGPAGQIVLATWPGGLAMRSAYACDEDWEPLCGEALDYHVREWLSCEVMPAEFGESSPDEPIPPFPAECEDGGVWVEDFDELPAVA